MTTKTERCQRCGATVPVTDEDTHGLCESCGLAELETWGEVQAEDARHDAVDAFRRYLEETDDREWSELFELRCRAKRGERLSPEEQARCAAAYAADPARYKTMGDEVFVVTAPFGSNVRAR